MPLKLTAAANENDRHTADVTALLYHNGKLYSGGDDGKIKVWSSDLKLIKEIDAHPVNVYCLAVNGKHLFSASNDGTVKCWSLENLSWVSNIIECSSDEVFQLYYSELENKLYSGDSKGVVKVFQNGSIIGQYDTMEEIHGLCAKENYIFTAGNMDVTITETKPGSKSQYTTRKTFDGRSPMCLINDCNLCYTNRDGRTISVIDISPGSGFKIAYILQGHKMVINAVTGVNSTNFLCSGGYDNEVKIWNLSENKVIDSYSTGKCINALVANEKDIYISGINGFIEKISQQ